MVRRPLYAASNFGTVRSKLCLNFTPCRRAIFTPPRTIFAANFVSVGKVTGGFYSGRRFGGRRSRLEFLPRSMWDGAGHRKGPAFFMSSDPLRVLSKIEAVPEGCLLTVILPLRVRNGHEDAIKRLDFALLDKKRPRELGFLVVDDGSAADLAERVVERCRQLGFGYLRLETGDLEFSVGRCRNIGAMVAKSSFVFMQDLDLMPWDGFYRELLLEMEIQRLPQDARAFLMVPSVYLTAGGTESFLECLPQERRQRFQHSALAGDARVVEKMSTGTSANVYNRLWYLSRGGNCSDFEGWGAASHFQQAGAWQAQVVLVAQGRSPASAVDAGEETS